MQQKRERSRRVLAVLAATVVTALVAAACGSTSDSESPASNSPASESAGPGSSASTAPDEGGESGAASQSGSSADADACEPSEGVTDSKILLGGSYPLSGPLSSAAGPAWGAQAYFKYINDQGGVNGRQIEFDFSDDAYDPSRTVANVKKYVDSEHVFGMFNIFGTAPNLAVYDSLNEQGIPDIYPVSGDARWGANHDTHPWTVPWQPTLQGEGAVYGSYLKDTMPDAKVAVLYQNDDFGKALLAGLESGIEGSGVEIVKSVSYEVSTPSVAPQVSSLSNSGADVFMNFTTQQFATQAIKAVGTSSWNPTQFLTNIDVSVAAVLKPAGLENAKGIISTAMLKDPSDSQWADSEDMKLYKEEAGKSIPSTASVDDSLVAQGWSTAATFVHAIESVDCFTRQNVIDALLSIDGYEAPLLLPGIDINTSPDDPFAIEKLQPIKFDGSSWQVFGDSVDISGKSEG